MTTETLSHEKQRLIDRSAEICARAIGHDFTIRTDKNVTVTGKIVTAEFGRFYHTGRAYGVVFKIVMECGQNKTLREFFVRKLPQ